MLTESYNLPRIVEFCMWGSLSNPSMVPVGRHCFEYLYHSDEETEALRVPPTDKK